MNNAFEVSVTEANGRVRTKTATIAGGSMTAAQLAEHYEKINAFPGARSVEITELEGTITPPSAAEVQRQSRQRRDSTTQLKPLSTPKPIIKPKYVLPEDQRAPHYRTPGGAPFSGDGLGSPVASPVSSPSADAARANHEAAQAEAVSTTADLAAVGQPDSSKPQPEQGETEAKATEAPATQNAGSQASEAPATPPAPKETASSPMAGSPASPNRPVRPVKP